MPETTSPATSTAPESQPSSAPPPAAASPTSPPTTSSPPSAPSAPIAALAPQRPDGVPEGFWDKGTNAVKYGDWGKSYEELRAFKASDDARRAALPAQPDLYELQLAEGFKFPGEMRLEPDSPFFKAARQAAHEEGLSQAAFTKFFRLYTKDAADRHQQWLDWNKQEDEALGENREARKQARDKNIEAWAKALYPANPGPNGQPSEADVAAAHMKGTPVSAALFRFQEKLFEALSRQGVKPYSGAGRETSEGRQDGLPDNWDNLDAVTQRTWLLQNPQWRAQIPSRH